eukprot:gene1876-22163_t
MKLVKLVKLALIAVITDKTPGAGEGPNAIPKSSTLPLLWKQGRAR